MADILPYDYYLGLKVFHLLEKCSEKPTKPKKKEVTNKYRIFCRLNHSNGKDTNHLGENVDRFPSYQVQVIFNILASVKKLEDLTPEGLTREIQSLNAEVILVKEMYESSYKKSQKLKEAERQVGLFQEDIEFLQKTKEKNCEMLQHTCYNMQKIANMLYSAEQYLRESSQGVIHHRGDDKPKTTESLRMEHQFQKNSYIKARELYEFYLRKSNQIDVGIARTTESLVRAQQALQALQATSTAN
jgi:hypothetical protein